MVSCRLHSLNITAFRFIVYIYDQITTRLKKEHKKPHLLSTDGEGALVAINGNFAIDAGLNPTKDAVLLESASQDNPYVNIVACKKGNENDKKIKALMEVLKSDQIKEFITSTYSDGSVIPVN